MLPHFFLSMYGGFLISAHKRNKMFVDKREVLCYNGYTAEGKSRPRKFGRQSVLAKCTMDYCFSIMVFDVFDY